MEKPSFENDYILTDRFDRKRSMLLWVSALGALLAFSTSSENSIAGFGLQVSPMVAQISVLLAIVFHAIEFSRAAWLSRILNDHLQRDFDQVARRHHESELLDGIPKMLSFNKIKMDAIFHDIDSIKSTPIVQAAILDASESAANIVSSEYYNKVAWTSE